MFPNIRSSYRIVSDWSVFPSVPTPRGQVIGILINLKVLILVVAGFPYWSQSSRLALFS